MIKHLFIWALLLSWSCSVKGPPQKVSLQNLEGKAFGSTWELKYSGTQDPEVIRSEIEAFLKAFDQEFSTYRGDSKISEFNQLGSHQHLKVSSRFIDLLKLAQQFHKETQGAFDPSMGKTIRLWGFGGGAKNSSPSKKNIMVAKNQSGFDAIKWNERDKEVWKTRPLSLDLNAFAPGFAGDLFAKILVEKGVQNFVLNIGGEILFRGEREKNKSWVAGIETPDENLESDVHLAFKIKDLALATSGSYRQFRLDKGNKNSHIINPFTHHPHQSDIVSASVLAETAAQADAWSTALMILGEKGFPQAQKYGLKVLLIQKTPQGNFKQIISPSLKEYLEINKL